MYSTLETLEKIFDAVRDPETWYQGGLYSPDGKRCCLLAHIYSMNERDLKDSCRDRLLDTLVQRNEPADLGRYNDTHTHEEVVALVRKAILAEKKGCDVLLEQNLCSK